MTSTQQKRSEGRAGSPSRPPRAQHTGTPLDTFFAKLDELADAPAAVAKLRELILLLAIQGKVVDQRSSDEPAKKLLERIRANKARLTQERTIRRLEVEPVRENEMPFPVPQSWTWARLGEIGDWGSGSTPARGNPELYGGGITWLKSGELNDNPALAGSAETVTELALNSGTFRRNQIGDVLFAMYGATIGKVAILAEPAVSNQAVCGCTPFEGVLNRYLFFYLISQRPNFHAASEGGAQPNLSKDKIVQYLVPLPPLAEQKRIVAKVDELMALCDRLEAQLTERESRHRGIEKAALARFAEAPTPANLELLFHDHIAISPADLRKSILTLAVQGKLVPQDPTDEPASVLIDQIAQQRRNHRAKDFGVIDPDDVPFEIPDSWKWTRMGNIALSSDSGWSPQCDNQRRSGTEWGVLKVSAVSWGEFRPEENKGILPGMEARPDCEVQPGDFLLSRANTEELVARSVVVEETPPRLMMSDKIVRFIFPDEIEKRFINLANLSDHAREHYARNASGTSSSMKNVGRDVMCRVPIPLPPEAEQRRIVAKVDQLMALVNRLETQLTASRTTADHLLSALVAELTSA